MLQQWNDPNTRSSAEQTSITYPPQPNGKLNESIPANEIFYLSESDRPLRVDLVPQDPTGAWRWLVALGLVSFSTAIAIRPKSLPVWYDRLLSYPHTVAVILGLGWWLVLRPRELGLLLVAVAFLSLLYRQIQRYREG